MSSEDKPEKPLTRRQQGLPPLSEVERKRISLNRKRETHSDLNIFIQHAYKEDLKEMCEERGVTQSVMVETLIDYWKGRISNDT